MTKITALLAVLFLFLPNGLRAWTPSTVRTTPLVPLRWPGGSVSYQTNPAHGSNVAGTDADVQAAVDGAFGAWSGVTDTGVSISNEGTTGIATRNNADGINSVLFQDTASQQQMGSSPLATTFFRFDNDGTIRDADIVVNTQRFSTATPASNAVDLQSVLAHEVGHVLGINHSTLLSATMFADPRGSLAFRTLTDDDVAAIRATYPPAVKTTGAISGTVLENGAGVFGAAVFARAANGAVAAATVTVDGAGTFLIDGLPPGAYTLGVEPLDGRVSQSNLGGYFQVAGSFDTSFKTRLPSGSTVTVAAGQTAQAGTIDVTPGQPALNPSFNVGIEDPNLPSLSIGGRALFVVAATPGLSLAVEESDGFTSIGVSSRTVVTIPGNGIVLGPPETVDTLTFYRLGVQFSTAPGTYDIVFTNGSESAVMSGGFRVLAPTGPPPPNQPPLARASVSPRFAETGQVVRLDATRSSDPDLDSLSYIWTQSFGPPVSIADADKPIATFIPLAAGEYVFDVAVSDGRGGVTSSQALVSASVPEVTLGSSGVTRDARVGPGLNLISIPASVTMTGGGRLTASALASVIGAPCVVRFQGGAPFAYLPGVTGTDFELEGNTAYLVRAPKSLNIHYVGEAWPDALLQVNPARGLQAVGLPRGAFEGQTVGGLLDSLGYRLGFATVEGRFRAVARPEGADAPLARGMGLFLSGTGAEAQGTLPLAE